jgi:hypothetical protein
MTTTLRIGPTQHSALAVYVFDSIHGDEDCGEAPFPGTLSESSLTVDLGQREAAVTWLLDASNSADDDGDVEFRDALAALVPRVRRAV